MMRRILPMLALGLLVCAGALAEGVPMDRLDVTLYFRFGQTDRLGVQRVSIDLRREETVATLIAQRLIEGPTRGDARLSGLFPQETRLISAQGDGRTAFITLSRAFLGRPVGAPADWETKPTWTREAALRRRLAFQSLVLALTEDGRYQRVQLYIADNDDAVPERIPMRYLNPDETELDLRLAACGRDESSLLTQRDALAAVMEAWKAQDWERAWPFLSETSEAGLGQKSAFQREIEGLGVLLLRYTLTPGSVSPDGQRATLVLDATIRSEKGGEAELIRESVPLFREADNWVMAKETLLRLMIRD